MNDFAWLARPQDVRLSKWFGKPWPVQFWCHCCPSNGLLTTFGGNQVGAIRLADTDQWESDAWTSMTNMPTATNDPSAMSFGTVFYSVYGTNSGGLTTNCDEYVTDVWTSKTAAPSPARVQSQGMVIGSLGYVACGSDGGSTRYQDNDEYNPAGNSWTSRTDSPTPARDQHGAAGWGDYGYIVCGFDGSRLQDNDRYSPSGDSWTSMTSAPTPARTKNRCAAINSQIFSFGGTNSTGPSLMLDTDEYDIAGDSWAAQSDMPSPAREWFGCDRPGTAASGTVAYITCGQAGTGRIQDHDEYNASGNSWSSRANAPSPARLANASGTG